MRVLLPLIGLLLFALPAQADEPYHFGTSHFMDYATTSVEMTNGVGSQTRAIRMVCTTDCYFATAISGSTAQAIAKGSTSSFLPADEPQYLRIPPGGKVAVIQATANGTVAITELSK